MGSVAGRMLGSRLMSGNEAVAQGAWDAGVKVATGYPGTPSTEILETLSRIPEARVHWSVNEKVALEVAIGASAAGARALCTMKHVGMNVAADPLMSQALAGSGGGLVIAVADDIGLSSSQNEQDSRYWGRFAHLPVLEPADSQEALDMTIRAYGISEEFGLPVLLRLTTRVCHVKTVVRIAGRRDGRHLGFQRQPERWVLTPAHARQRVAAREALDARLAGFSEVFEGTAVVEGSDRRVGFIAAGPAFLHVREAFPDSPVLKLGLTYPVPSRRIAEFAKGVERVVVVEETEPLIQHELAAAGIAVHGKDILPKWGEMTPTVLRPAVKRLLGDQTEDRERPDPAIFPRPPTMCAGCPHLPVHFCLSRLKKAVRVAGDIGCYTLGAGQPWGSLDTTICMGASLGMALGMDLGRSSDDTDVAVVAVIGDSTFLHTGMQGLLEIVYNRGNVTVLLLDNSTTGMTGGQDHAGTGADIRGHAAARVDLTRLVEALGVNPDRVHNVDPYDLPVLFRRLVGETEVAEPSVIITNRPCVFTRGFRRRSPYSVAASACTGCGNCLNVGCPAIGVVSRQTADDATGSFIVSIDGNACTGCGLCAATCGPRAIVVEPQP